MQLRDIQFRGPPDLLDTAGRLVHKHADSPDPGASSDLGRLLRRNVSRAPPIEVKPDRICAALDRGRGVVLIRDAADLDDHSLTSRRSSASGSPDFMRCSPTRKAEYPAE